MLTRILSKIFTNISLLQTTSKTTLLSSPKLLKYYYRKKPIPFCHPKNIFQLTSL